MAEEN